MRTTPAASLLHSREFEDIVRQQVRCELRLVRLQRLQKYKLAGFAVAGFFLFVLAITCASILTDLIDRWLFGR